MYSLGNLHWGIERPGPRYSCILAMEFCQTRLAGLISQGSWKPLKTAFESIDRVGGGGGTRSHDLGGVI